MVMTHSTRRSARPKASLERPESPFKISRKTPRTVGGLVILGQLLGNSVIGGSPFYLNIINSFKSPEDYAENGPLQFPVTPYFDGIIAFWNRVNFPLKLWNSFLISGTVAVAAVIISVLNAYVIG